MAQGLSGLRKAATAALNENIAPNYDEGVRRRDYFPPELVGHYFKQVADYVQRLKHLLPVLYEDFYFAEAEPDTKMASTPPSWHFSRAQTERLVRDIDQVFEIRANSELAEPLPRAHRRVFVSHGRSSDWRIVQSFIEKDAKLNTLELAQQPNEGRTVIEKLEQTAARCDSAVIVMTGATLLTRTKRACART